MTVRRAVAGLSRRMRGVAACAGGLFAAACAGSSREPMLAAMRAPDNARFAAGGISSAEAGVRYGLARGDSAGVRASIARLPGDTLLRLLHWGLAHHRAGRWAESNAALQAAEQLAEERYTKSVRQAVGSFLLNDRVLDYIPPAHERAFIHYYGMLNYAALGDRESALVEARKANLFLDRYAREQGNRAYTVDAAVEYLAGALHLDAGDRNDALVSFRRSDSAYATYQRAFGMGAPPFVASDVSALASSMGVDIARPDRRVTRAAIRQQGTKADSTGTLLLLVENGYIAHKVPQTLYVALTDAEATSLRHRHRDRRSDIGVEIADRTLRVLRDPGTSVHTRRHADGMVFGALLTGGELLTLAWPRFELVANGVDSVLAEVGGQVAPAVVMNDLSAIAARNFEEEKPAMVRRMIIRGVTRLALTKYAEHKAEEEGDKRAEELGKLWKFVARLMGQGAAAAVERADTRSWSSLPSEVRGVKLALPAGDHAVRLRLVDADGRARDVDLGMVRVERGRLAVRNVFVDGRSRGATTRFAYAGRGVRYRAETDSVTGETRYLPALDP